MKLSLYFFLLIIHINALPSFSQRKNNTDNPATTRANSLFTDNQSQEKPGHIPTKWNVLSGKCIIERTGTEAVISLTGDETKISPNTDITSLLSKGFEASFELFYNNGQRYYCRIFPYPDIEFKQTEISCGDHVAELAISKPAAEHSWQKIMIKCEVSQLNIYVNGKLELTIPDTGKIPDNFALGNWQTGGEKYYVKNVNIKGSGSNPQNQQIILLSPANNSKVYDKNLHFSWKSSYPGTHSKYILSVFEILHGQTPGEAAMNLPSFQKEGIEFISQKYLLASKSIERGKNYCWNVKQIDGANEYISETRTFSENSTTPLKFPGPKIQCDNNGTLVKGDPCKNIIQEVKGDVEIQYDPPDGKWVKAVIGMEIKEGMKICTGEGSSAVLAFGTNAIAILSSESLAEIRVLECTQDGLKVDIFIDPGVAQVSVKQLQQLHTDIQVSTPRLTASVRG